MNRFELIPTNEYPTFDMKVTLKPSFKCNQNCWFCTEYDNDALNWTDDMHNEALDILHDSIKDKEDVFIYFYGGEPTLYKRWEEVQYTIVKKYPNKKLFIQTQTNMSVNRKRLRTFLKKINELKSDMHTIDICSSYHLTKQRVEVFKEKMDICNEYNALGLCFFSTDYLNEDRFLSEFNTLAKAYPTKLKLRFTEIGEGVNNTVEALQYPIKDNLKSFEFRYFMEKYPELQIYYENGFNFMVDDVKMNFSEVSANDVHKQFRFMKCECGTKNLVIDHKLNVYRCNDDFKNGRINVPDSDPKICLNKECYDGLEFTKWK